MIVKESKEISEGNLNSTPEFYRSMSGNPSYGRFSNRIRVNTNLPRVLEIITKTLIVDSSGLILTTLPFSRIYSDVPLVAGVALKPNGKFTVIPTGLQFDGLGSPIDNEDLKIDSVTNSYVRIKFVGPSSTAGKVVIVKLKVLDIALNEESTE